MVRRWMRGSKGLQTLEWVALALVVLALIGAVTAYLNGPGGAQVAAPIQQALQRYAWCLEGAGGCPGAGGGNAFGANPPGVRPPEGNPPGVNPPGGNPPGVNPSGGKPPDPWWCVTHPAECASRSGEWLADKWEDVKQGAGQAWEGLKTAANNVWTWLDQNKGIVAGVVVAIAAAAPILATGGLAIPVVATALTTAGGALLFGGLYHQSGPKPGWQGWLEAFALAGTGAVMGYLTIKGGIMLVGKVGWAGIPKLLGSKGLVGGVSSGISYMLLTPHDQRSIGGLALAVGAGMITEMLAWPAAKAAVVSIVGAIEAARRKELTWQTPIREFGKSFFLEQPGSKKYNRVFGRSVGKGIGWLSGKGISISPPKFAMQILNRISWDMIKSKLFGI